MEITPVSRSSIFTCFNALRPYVREGKLDRDRVNRGLGIAMHRPEYIVAKFQEYKVDENMCWCDDMYYRGDRYTCKHLIARALLVNAMKLDQERRVR